MASSMAQGSMVSRVSDAWMLLIRMVGCLLRREGSASYAKAPESCYCLYISSIHYCLHGFPINLCIIAGATNVCYKT